MEVCGTHTVAIFREGIRQLLPEGIELVSGPGCPVCVTDQSYMDKALAYAAREDLIIATFGDMLKVPGTTGSLAKAKAEGAHIEIVYSPLEVIGLGKKYPNKKVVFLAVGFETTIAVIAATIKTVAQAKADNIYFLVSHKLVPPALRALLDSGENHIDGFLLPGHVSVIIGEEPYQFLAEEYNLPCAIAGFDGLEILAAVAALLEQRQTGKSYIANEYKSVVAREGNPTARRLMAELYEVIDDTWRGLGKIPASGLRLRAPYDRLDAEITLPLTAEEIERAKQPERATPLSAACQCGRVLQGLIKPPQCPLFGTACTADHPVGACMVSVEGTCAAWYKYGTASGGLAWDSAE